jgi:LytR cell envelope-related transcriptional attenuator
VDHTAPSTELVRPWRTATLVATAIAAIELALLIVCGIVLLGRSLAPHVHAAAERRALAPKRAVAKLPAAAKPARPVRVVARLPRAKTKVVVLNGNGVQGAAAEAASLVQARGYRIKQVGNAPHTGYPKTIVMYRPGFAGEAKRFARDLNLGLVEPLDGMKPRQLHGAQVLIILGASR